MDVTPLLSRANNLTLDDIRSTFPELKFAAGSVFSWSASDSTIYYPIDTDFDNSFLYSLLHEIAHGLLVHNSFTNDLNLISLERDAWEKSKKIAQSLGTNVDEEHIEKCMDTYRDWLYTRSLCPNCHQCGLQTSKTTYECIFCNDSWRVSLSRLCKVTRRAIKKNS